MDIPEFDEICKNTKTSFWFIGIPFDQRVIKLRYYILHLILLIIIVAEAAFFFSNISAENFLKLTELAPCVSMGWLSPIKLVLVTFSRQSIFELTHYLKKLYNEAVSDPKKKEIVRRNSVILKYFLKFFYIWHWIMVSVYNFSALVIMIYYYYTKNVIVYLFPYSIWIPFSIETWYSWLIVYITSVAAGYICVLYFLTVDVTFFIMTSLICAQFAVLSNEIQYLDRDTSHCLGGIIERHQYILKLSEDLEEIFRAPNLFNVMFGSLEICALGFNLTMGPVVKLPGVILFLVATLIQLFMINFFGENLLNESRKIGEAAYLCKWYDMDKISKKNIMFLMLRSHKPQEVTAYKFSVLSYASFTKVMSNSWSYFTILKTVYE